MQVTETNADGLKREFKIVVPSGTIETRMQVRLKELSNQVRMPGFRPGKVPMSLMRKRYGASVMGEVLEQTVQESSSATLNERNLRPAMQPKIEITAFDEGKDLEYTMAVELMPEIGDLDFSKFKIVKPKAKVDDKEIEDALNRIAENRQVAEPIEGKRAAKKGDVVEIDFIGRIGGEEFQGGKGEGFDLELGSGQFIPGFEDQLIGAKAGDKVMVKVNFPDDYHAKDLAGKEAEFEVDVKAIKAKKKPEINDDFAKSLGMEDLEGVKKAIRDQIEGEYGNVTRSKMKRQLLDKLSDEVDFEVPEGMLDIEFQSIWQQVEDAMKNDRLDEDDKGKSEDQLREEYRALAERRVRLGLLLADVGQKNEVQVTQEDLNRAIMQEAMRYPGQEQAVFRYFQDNQQAVNQLRAPIYEDKVVDFILSKTEVEEKEVSPEELMKEDEEGAAEAKPAKKSAKKSSSTKKKAEEASAEAADNGEAEAKPKRSSKKKAEEEGAK